MDREQQLTEIAKDMADASIMTQYNKTREQFVGAYGQRLYDSIFQDELQRLLDMDVVFNS